MRHDAVEKGDWMVLTNTTFLGCGFKSLGFRVLSPMGAAGKKTQKPNVCGFSEARYP